LFAASCGAGDKSISHRALIFSALAVGQSRVRALLESADGAGNARALRAMGVGIPRLAPTSSSPASALTRCGQPHEPLDCANSGTTTRLLAGLVAGLAGRRARFRR
jgi:3-phosphoshikimate 1-carboxyvinyltransferase